MVTCDGRSVVSPSPNCPKLLYPTAVTVPLSNISTGDVVWLLISGSTNNMQTRLANAVIRFQCVNGTTEELELTPPINYWSLTPIAGIDYDYVRDGFCLPAKPPPTVQLGGHNRAMVYSWRPSGALTSVTIEALSLEVVVGLLAVSVSRLDKVNTTAAAAKGLTFNTEDSRR